MPADDPWDTEIYRSHRHWLLDLDMAIFRNKSFVTGFITDEEKETLVDLAQQGKQTHNDKLLSYGKGPGGEKTFRLLVRTLRLLGPKYSVKCQDLERLLPSVAVASETRASCQSLDEERPSSSEHQSSIRSKTAPQHFVDQNTVGEQTHHRRSITQPISCSQPKNSNSDIHIPKEEIVKAFQVILRAYHVLSRAGQLHLDLYGHFFEVDVHILRLYGFQTSLVTDLENSQDVDEWLLFYHSVLRGFGQLSSLGRSISRTESYKYTQHVRSLNESLVPAVRANVIDIKPKISANPKTPEVKLSGGLKGTEKGHTCNALFNRPTVTCPLPRVPNGRLSSQASTSQETSLGNNVVNCLQYNEDFKTRATQHQEIANPASRPISGGHTAQVSQSASDGSRTDMRRHMPLYTNWQPAVRDAPVAIGTSVHRPLGYFRDQDACEDATTCSVEDRLQALTLKESMVPDSGCPVKFAFPNPDGKQSFPQVSLVNRDQIPLPNTSIAMVDVHSRPGLCIVEVSSLEVFDKICSEGLLVNGEITQIKRSQLEGCVSLIVVGCPWQMTPEQLVHHISEAKLGTVCDRPQAEKRLNSGLFVHTGRRLAQVIPGYGRHCPVLQIFDRHYGSCKLTVEWPVVRQSLCNNCWQIVDSTKLSCHDGCFERRIT